MNTIIISESDKEVITQLVSKLKELKESWSHSLRIIDFSSLYTLITKEEQLLIEKYLQLDPKNFGFTGEYLGIMNVPSDLITVSDQSYRDKGEKTVISPQFVPKNVYQFYKKLTTAISNDLGSSLLIESAYRSPAYQMLVLFHYLQMNKFDLKKTLGRVALPGYSEHTYPARQAIDFMTTEGVPSAEEPLKFADTVEYKWLVQHAHTYNFYLSYPENNSQGIMYEPWHWHYED